MSKTSTKVINYDEVMRFYGSYAAYCMYSKFCNQFKILLMFIVLHDGFYNCKHLQLCCNI
jgi:hypothetical protein